MELKDTLLSDNLRKAPPMKVAVSFETPTSIVRTVVAEPKPVKAKVEHKSSKLSPSWIRRVDVHLVEEARAILKPNKAKVTPMHPHPTRDTTINRHTVMHESGMVKGYSLLEPDEVLGRDAYDGSLRSTVYARSQQAYYARTAEHTRAKGSRLVGGFNYRLEGRKPNGEPL